jgi:hypothetical protein
LTFEGLKAMLERRGFDYLEATDLGQYLNDAYLLDICEDEDWPFLEETVEGTAPLTIADLRTIEYVIDTTIDRQLYPLLRGRLVNDHSTDLTEAGSPANYYTTALDTINVFPSSATDQLLVRYWRVPSALSGTDEPLLPSRFHTLIVDGAVVRAYEDSDDYELGEAAKTRFDQRLHAMRDSLGMLQHDAPDDYIVVEDPASLR